MIGTCWQWRSRVALKRRDSLDSCQTLDSNRRKIGSPFPSQTLAHPKRQIEIYCRHFVMNIKRQGITQSTITHWKILMTFRASLVCLMDPSAAVYTPFELSMLYYDFVPSNATRLLLITVVGKEVFCVSIKKALIDERVMRVSVAGGSR